MEMHEYGIAGRQAPELTKFKWVDGKGNDTRPIQLDDYQGKFIVLYCFQSWCPGCHSVGLPALKKMVDALEGNDQVVFLAIQTVFEGKAQNTFGKLKATQTQYELNIPFGQDEGDAGTGDISSVMYHYRTGGTPWFILIDQNRRVIFNDFHLNTDKAIEYLKTIQ